MATESFLGCREVNCQPHLMDHCSSYASVTGGDKYVTPDLEGKVSFHQIHKHITHSHIITLKYTYTHSQRHMHEHIVTLRSCPSMLLDMHLPLPTSCFRPGTLSALPRGKKSGHLCTLSWIYFIREPEQVTASSKGMASQ